MEASQHSLLAACFTLHSINATLFIVPQRGAGLWMIKSISSHPISLRSNLIFSTHLRLGLPIGLFPCIQGTIIDSLATSPDYFETIKIVSYCYYRSNILWGNGMSFALFQLNIKFKQYHIYGVLIFQELL
jgi:hypothetical protein